VPPSDDKTQVFRGRQYRVELSAAQTYDLYSALVNRADQEPQMPAMEATVEFLRARMDAGRQEARAFDLDPPPEELDDPGRLSCLSRLLSAFAHEIAAQPAAGGRARVSLLARLVELRDLVIGAGAGTRIEPEQDLPLSSAEAGEVELLRLQERLRQLVPRSRRGRSSEGRREDLEQVLPEWILPLLDRLLELASRIEPEDRRRRIMAGAHFDRATVLYHRGDRAGAAAEYRRAAEAEEDPSRQAEFLGYAADLEPSS
jgi:hypothetical protein